MSIFACVRCDEPIHQTPIVSTTFGTYAMCCTEQCKERYEAQMRAMIAHRRAMQLGRAAFNGA